MRIDTLLVALVIAVITPILVCANEGARTPNGPEGNKDQETQPPKLPTIQVPKGWQAVKAGEFSLARFQIGEGDRIALMSVTPLAGEAGGLVANINRWRAEIGLKALEHKDALNSLQPIKVDGIAAHAVDLTGSEVDGKPKPRIIVAIVRQGDHTWFFRLSGSATIVNDQKAAFDGLLKSVRFKK